MYGGTLRLVYRFEHVIAWERSGESFWGVRGESGGWGVVEMGLWFRGERGWCCGGSLVNGEMCDQDEAVRVRELSLVWVVRV